MRQVSRVVGAGLVAVSVAACGTVGQGGHPLGQSVGQTVRDHPQTAVGAGVGAAGGAVVGGLAGGTKGAVVGGLLGALTGGVIGNYVERREVGPRSVGGSETASTAGTPVLTPSVPGPAAPVGAGAGQAAMIRVDQTQAQPADLRPGSTVNLNATYTVMTPADQLLTVRETREVRLNGELVANPAIEVVRQSGTFTSSLPITLPPNARPGRYEVAMTVASGDRQSTSTTSFVVH